MTLDNLKAQTVTYPKGAYIFKKNDFTRDLYIIQNGSVKVFKQSGVRTAMLSTMGKGSVLGEVAAIDGGPRSATAQAVEDTEVLVIPPQEFTKKISSMPEWFMKICKILVQRLRETVKRIEEDAIRNSEYNVVVLLCYFFANTTTIKVSKVQNDIMQLLHMSFKDLREILENLKEKSIIIIIDESISIDSLEKLDIYAKNLQEISDTANSL